MPLDSPTTVDFTAAAMGRQRNAKEAILYAGALLLAACTYKVLFTIHEPNIADFESVVLGIVEGTPRGIAFQNRLLGPWLVVGLSNMGISGESALRRFHFAAIMLLSLVLTRLLRRMELSIPQALLCLSAFFLVFLSLQFYWYHTWDIVDLTIFSLFAYGVVQQKHWSYFVPLFAIGLLNRESALFIAFYIAIDGLDFDVEKRQLSLRSKAQLFLGSALFVAGVLYTTYIRHALFIALPGGLPDHKAEVLGNEVHLVKNIETIFLTNFRSLNAVYSLLLLAALLYTVSRWRAFSDANAKGFLAILFILASIMMFGIAAETRVFFLLMPMFLFLWLDLQRRDDRRAGASGQGDAGM